jgi:hypothetical protein
MPFGVQRIPLQLRLKILGIMFHSSLTVGNTSGTYVTAISLGAVLFRENGNLLIRLKTAIEKLW